MRFAPSVVIGLLAVNGLAQTVADPDQQPEPSAIAEPQPSAPAAEPSAPAQQPSDPSNNGDDDDSDDTPATDVANPTAVPEPTADEPAPTADASQVSEGEQPTATANDDDDDEATSAIRGTATADATATDDDTAPTATEADDDDATNTATLTATESAAPTSTGAIVEVDLKNATIGDNAKLIEVDGKPAIKLSAPANGQATFTVPVDTDSDSFNDDDLIYIVASILVGEASAKLRKRATKTDCTLQIQAGSANVYSEPLYTTDGKFQDVKSNGIRSSDNPGAANVQVTQSCGDRPSPLTVGNVRAGTESGIKSSSGSGGSGGSGSGSGGSGSSGSGGKGGNGNGNGSGSETSTADGANASETGGSGNVGSKARASIGALAAALLAAAAFV